LLGDKIVSKLLMKKFHVEVPENRLIITVILWNLLYVWPDYLVHVLIPVVPNDDGHVRNVQLNLLEDLWEEEYPQNKRCGASSAKSPHSIRSVCVISAARIIAGKRLPTPQMCSSLVNIRSMI
jgi:hypothetical protein